jgi:hypothetical protein
MIRLGFIMRQSWFFASRSGNETWGVQAVPEMRSWLVSFFEFSQRYTAHVRI